MRVVQETLILVEHIGFNLRIEILLIESRQDVWRKSKFCECFNLRIEILLIESR